MYSTLLILHSIVRWLVLLSLFYSIYKALNGLLSNRVFTKFDNSIRHNTATIAHVQLMIGLVLYFHSPIVKYFWANSNTAAELSDDMFYGIIHILLMVVAVVVLTVGSAMAKRKKEDNEKFKTMFIWFALALLIIFIAIPWPFSPLANRPFLRLF